MQTKKNPVVEQTELSPERGEYTASTPSDTRGPCPMVNALANHGYISRNGREIVVGDLKAGLQEAGVGPVVGAMFSNPIFLERKHPDPATAQPARSIFGNLWYLLTHPWAILFSRFGLRDPGQTDSQGRDCLNLNQLALHGVVEHDVSLTRRDLAQGDSITPHSELIEKMLACSSDGRVLTMNDLVRCRKLRLAEQKEDNPKCNYDRGAHSVGCTEIALILTVLGDGKQVSCEYVRTFFRDEKLPIAEGWKSRTESPLGLIELMQATKQVKASMGMDVK